MRNEYIFHGPDGKTYTVQAWNLYEAEVSFAKRHGHWPTLAASVREGAGRRAADTVAAIYAFRHQALGVLVYIQSTMLSMHQARAVFEDIYGYRPSIGQLISTS